MMKEVLNPYVGLRPFETEESLLFFGRNEQISELLTRLHHNHFVAVVGSSGCGKSSLLKSGLIPALKAGYLVEGSDDWMIMNMKPGQNPLANLVSTLFSQINPGFSQSEFTAFMEILQLRGADAILEILAPEYKKKGLNFFLLVDQFEEIFRFAGTTPNPDDRDNAIDFVNIMLGLTQQVSVPFYVVITMRSDFIGECSGFNGLAEAMNQSQYLVPRLSRMQMKKSITGPAKLYGGSLSNRLVSRLLNEVVNTKDELPLLQHALMRIWQHGVHKGSLSFDLDDFEQIGGFEKALSNHAEEALEGMKETELLVVKKMFQALTIVDEGGRRIRRPKLLSQLTRLTGTPAETLLNLINRLNADSRSFLVLNKLNDSDDLLIDISHESLMRVWDRLRKWVDEEAESVKMYTRVCESAAMYESGKAGLWRDPELQVAIDWRNRENPDAHWASQYNELYPEAMSFLDNSLEDKNKQIALAARRRKIMAVLVSVFLLVVSGLALWANRERNNAEREKDRADLQKKIALENEFLARRKSQEADSNRQLALLESVNAINAKKDADEKRIEALKEKQNALNSARIAEENAKIAKDNAEEAERQKSKANDERDKANAAMITAHEKTKESLEAKEKLNNQKMRIIAQNLALTAQNNTFEDKNLKALLALQAYRFNREYHGKDWDPGIFSALFSAYRAMQQQEEYLHNFNSEAVNHVAFQPGTRNIASIDDNGNLVMSATNPMSSDPVKLKKQIYILEHLAFSPDGKRIAVTTDTRALLIYDVQNPSIAPELKKFDKLEKFTAVLWNTHHLVLADNKRNIYILNAKTFAEEAKYTLESTALCLAHDAQTGQLLAGCSNGSIYMFKSGTDFNPKAIIQKGPSAITALTCLDRSGALVYGNYNGKVYRMKNYQSGSPELLGSHRSKISGITYSKGFGLVAAASLDGTIKLWNLKTQEAIPVCFCNDHNGYVLSAGFDTEGNYLVTGGKDMTVRTYSVDQQKIIDALESKLNRNLRKEEWDEYIGSDVKYEKTIKRIQ